MGTTIADKYKIIDKLGEGGMGTVYRALQQPIDRQVAVKVLLNKLIDDDMAIRRFEQEARAVSKMQHPNTVTIYDYGQTDDGRFYLVMEFLKGRTLTDLLREMGPVPADLTCHIIRQVCASLADAHSAGIIHRDLKPDNIFLTSVGNDSNFVKVLDFGVAKLADNEAGATLTQTGMIFGTPKYMSPEQAEGKPIDFRADIYAIGVVMYELLTGRPPFLADTAVALLLKHISEPPPQFQKIRADLKVPARVEAITMQALAKDVDQRYLSVEQLSSDLTHFLSNMSTGAMPTVDAPNQAIGVGGAIPTEVVPNQNAQMTDGLMPPQAVPANLSLGVNASDASSGHTPMVGSGATEAAPMIHGSTQAAAVASPAGVDVATQAAPSVMPADSTSPISPESLAPSNELFLDASRRPPKEGRKLVIAGTVVFSLAIAILAFVVIQAPGPRTAPMLVSPPDQARQLEAANDPAQDRPLVESETPDKAAPTQGDKSKPKNSSPRNNRDKNKANRTTKNTRTTPAASPEKSDERTTEESRKVRFQFSSQPDGALVTLDGRQLGTTPFSAEFAKELTPVVFKFALKGRRSKEVTATLARDREVSAELEPAPTTSIKQPKRTKKPPKKDKPKPKPDSDRIDDSDPLNERVDELKDF